MNMKFLPGGVPVLVLAAAVAAAAPQQHVSLTDQQIQAQVEHKLRDHGLPGVTVTVRDAVVTLTGTVPSLRDKEEAIEQTRKIDDIKDVVSALTIPRAESDEALSKAIIEKLQRYVFFSIFDDVNVDVADGAATLTGYVTMPYKAQEMVRLATRVHGVQRVTDQIETLPVSGFDDQIRYAVASHIYNDPMFWNYAVQTNPPIHIVVKNGRVTLTGVVVSEVERRMAEILAREVFGVFSVDNKLRIES